MSGAKIFSLEIPFCGRFCVGGRNIAKIIVKTYKSFFCLKVACNDCSSGLRLYSKQLPEKYCNVYWKKTPIRQAFNNSLKSSFIRE